MIIQHTNTAVVILNWNGVTWLKDFIPVLLRNTRPIDADIIVVDNSSTDESVLYMQDHHQEVQLILLDKNYGFAEGYNKALEQISHPYSILLNSDVEVTPNWVQPLIKKLSESDDVAACQPKILDYKNKSHFEYAGASGGYIDFLGYPFCRGRIFNQLEIDKGQYDEETSIFWATGACLAVRTELYKEVGGLDALFFAHMEEIDLCWRLKQRGYEIYAVPSSKVYHVGGGTLSKVSPFKTYLNFRNNLLILYKNLPAFQLIKILFLRLILDGVAAFKFLIDLQPKHFFAVLKAHFHFYKMIPEFREKRRDNLLQTKVQKLSGVYCKSIVFQHFVNRVGRFSDLF